MRRFAGLTVLLLGLALPVWGQTGKIQIPTTAGSVTVHNTSTQVLAANTQRNFVAVKNCSLSNVWCSFGKAAVVGTAQFPMASATITNACNGDGFWMDSKVTAQALFCINDGAGDVSIVVSEGN